jgi:AraC-like DNA-binding protein
MNVFYELKPSDFYAYYTTSLEFEAHLHSHIELAYLLDGSVMACADTTESVLYPKDIFISFPNQIHSFQRVKDEKAILMIFSPDMFPEYKKLLSESLPISPVIKSAGANEEVHNVMLRLLELRSASGPFDLPILRGYLLILLGLLFSKMQFKPVEKANISTVKSILLYCSDNFNREFTLDEMAESLHINKSYISRVFSQKLHTSFTGYIHMLRITEACRLLLSCSMSITEIAYSTGFASVRTFNRAFRALKGMMPREFRAKGNESKLL